MSGRTAGASSETSKLLEWYEANRRELPWRGRSDPYEIWVSEVMLQQTRSETVERYYDRFLASFPTVGALAAATEEEVLASWSGLGYYRRARQLHAAAGRVAAAGGVVPTSVEELRDLPGIGAYTAAAIASLAFGVPAPVMDGNVERVLSRYLALEEEPKKAAGRRALLEQADRLMDPERAGDFNQAMMELGARVCTPRAPRCDDCPLARNCVAREQGTQELFPLKTPTRETVRESWIAVVVRHGGGLLMAKRSSDESLLAGLWELPSVPSGDAPSETLGETYGGDWTLGSELGRVRHSITHRALTISVRSGDWDPGDVTEPGSLAWIPEAELGALPTTSMVEKALAVARPVDV